MNHYGKLVKLMVELGGSDPEGIVLAFAGGSQQHGASLPGVGDLDVCGVVIGRPSAELMLENEDPKKHGHLTTSTSPDSEKNTQADVDVKAYTLRRWAQMALKGNPTAISYLFVPDKIKDMSLTPKDKWCCPYDAQQCEYPECASGDDRYRDSTCVRRSMEAHTATVWDKYILPNKNKFLSMNLAKAYLGLGQDQFERMLNKPPKKKVGLGIKQGLKVVDSETDALGYDPKPAMHMVRCLSECIELLSCGTITYPRPDVDRLLAIRQGKVTLQEILDMYGDLRSIAEGAATNPYPALAKECDKAALSELVSHAIIVHWKQKKWL